MDVDGVWQFVVNGEGMEQLIEYETCEEGASCDDEVQIPGQTVACRMQEITIRFCLYFSIKGRFDTFLFLEKV
ncbi:hypothetical protein QE152_g31464 [Popillia japonica]|uniref:Uncharacterized protein n=1 Tax=Popillia japonica TaxID=7064 RepID=A0AAW1J2G5_POPJA